MTCHQFRIFSVFLLFTSLNAHSLRKYVYKLNCWMQLCTNTSTINSTFIYVSSFEFNNCKFQCQSVLSKCSENLSNGQNKKKIWNVKKVFGSFPGSEVIKLISYFLPLIASTAVFGSVNSTSMVSIPESGDVFLSKISVGLGIRLISSMPANEKLDSNADPEMFKQKYMNHAIWLQDKYTVWNFSTLHWSLFF